MGGIGSKPLGLTLFHIPPGAHPTSYAVQQELAIKLVREVSSSKYGLRENCLYIGTHKGRQYVIQRFVAGVKVLGIPSYELPDSPTLEFLREYCERPRAALFVAVDI